MPGVGRDGPLAGPLHQEAAVAQDIEQLVTAHVMSTFREEVLKFAHSQAGHLPADLLHLVQEGRVVYLI